MKVEGRNNNSVLININKGGRRCRPADTITSKQARTIRYRT